MNDELLFLEAYLDLHSGRCCRPCHQNACQSSFQWERHTSVCVLERQSWTGAFQDCAAIFYEKFQMFPCEEQLSFITRPPGQACCPQSISSLLGRGFPADFPLTVIASCTHFYRLDSNPESKTKQNKIRGCCCL